MKIIVYLYHFLGGVIFAITLLFLAAVFVIVGTILESKTDSHSFAAHFTYNNPIFKILLAGFFINILFATLRRWPFRRYHIPFIMTHLGLLMLLAGALLKSYFGIQGNMHITEGSGSQLIFIPQSQILVLEQRSNRHNEKNLKHKLALNKTWNGRLITSVLDKKNSFAPGLSLEIKELYPHCKKKFLSWIKGDYVHISGYPPFKLADQDGIATSQAPPIIGTKAENPDQLAKDIYTKISGHTKILLIGDPEDNVHFYVFGDDGEAHKQVFSSEKINSLVVYDQGFGGYALQAEIPIGNQSDPLILESPLAIKYQRVSPMAKLEENIPLLTLESKQGRKKDIVQVPFDHSAMGLKWPILGGSYLLRFQLDFMEIPYRLRLRQARQINYPGTNQPYSFESDLIISNLQTGEKVETTISMNNVYETWDGYRFYLANISPSTADGVKKATIIINYDPAKYWLTYPGGIILSCGIIFLFWLYPRKKNSS